MSFGQLLSTSGCSIIAPIIYSTSNDSLPQVLKIIILLLVGVIEQVLILLWDTSFKSPQ
jgi:hypothetical protein